jgi:hypothetical protein
MGIQFAVGDKVEIMGGTYGKPGSKGKIVAIQSYGADIKIGKQVLKKYFKNIKLIPKKNHKKGA